MVLALSGPEAVPAPILIIGPTASGKSALAHALCEAFGVDKCGIVNLDILQVYRGVDIGTAKPDAGERARYGYLNIDTVECLERIDASAFAANAWCCVGALERAGKRAIVVGGSGLPTRAFRAGLAELPPADDALRARLRTCADERGWAWLHERLAAIDAVRAAQLHPNDRTRIERALELYILTGTPPSLLYTSASKIDSAKLAPKPIKVVCLEPEPEWLKGRIAKRTRVMFESGWVTEVAGLIVRYGAAALKEAQSMKAIGYREILDELISPQFERSLAANAEPCERAQNSLADLIATRTWQYARRQLTWNAGETAELRVPLNGDSQFNEVLPQVLLWR